MSEPLRKWSAVRKGKYIRVTLGSLTVRDLANATEARALAADLVRAADEVEPVTERSCFTCRHNENEVCHHPADEMEMAIDQYGLDAGCAKNNGGMPLDRSIPCPGWSAKVTT